MPAHPPPLSFLLLSCLRTRTPKSPVPGFAHPVTVSNNKSTNVLVRSRRGRGYESGVAKKEACLVIFKKSVMASEKQLSMIKCDFRGICGELWRGCYLLGTSS